MANVDLINANRAKKDEFYTQYSDIAAEISTYDDAVFYDKTVYCNCDNPNSSNFWSYFFDHFEKLHLKELVATFLTSEENCAYITSYNGRTVERVALHGNGDFRSQECVSVLSKADIVITNPPFSLFREYISLLVRNKKDFIIMGNMNAASCRDIFPLFMENKVRFGKSICSGDREFEVPKDYPFAASGYREDSTTGKRYIRVKGVRWFTTLQSNVRGTPLMLRDNYAIPNYPQYINFPAIEVKSVRNIPAGYMGMIGVPITILDKDYSDLYEIIGNSDMLANSIELEGKERAKPGRFYITDELTGMPKRLYERVVIKLRR